VDRGRSGRIGEDRGESGRNGANRRGSGQIGEDRSGSGQIRKDRSGSWQIGKDRSGSGRIRSGRIGAAAGQTFSYALRILEKIRPPQDTSRSELAWVDKDRWIMRRVFHQAQRSWNPPGMERFLRK